MHQAKFSLTQSQLEFVEQYRSLGFRDKSELVRAALERMKVEFERESLERSAELYASEYDSDPELREWAESARAGWPE